MSSAEDGADRKVEKILDDELYVGFFGTGTEKEIPPSIGGKSKAKQAILALFQQREAAVAIEAREIFVPVRGAEGYYEVSNTGKVRSVSGGRRKGIELKQQTYVNRTNRGYKTVSLVKNGKVMSAMVHRLVASAFLSNPLNKPTVNHKDSDRTNNDVNNLEWATHSENEVHAHANGKVIWNKGRFGVRANVSKTEAELKSTLNSKDGKP